MKYLIEQVELTDGWDMILFPHKKRSDFSLCGWIICTPLYFILGVWWIILSLLFESESKRRKSHEFWNPTKPSK